jgi:hypothetical protein
MSSGRRACRTGKKRYRDHQEATRARASARTGLATGSLVDTGRVPVREYLCEFCGGYHLTSQAQGASS